MLSFDELFKCMFMLGSQAKKCLFTNMYTKILKRAIHLFADFSKYL